MKYVYQFLPQCAYREFPRYFQMVSISSFRYTYPGEILQLNKFRLHTEKILFGAQLNATLKK